ncbi:MAG: hypothetical protein JOZ62_16505 [Acidobacteriaceae bacterium]|nr:hypothetical protein [Acidobacteriaceae bacterium]
MYITAFSYEDAQRIAVEQDPEVKRAIEVMPKAAELLAKSKQLERQRASR